MTYEQQILHILTKVGEQGISVGLLSKHLYNMNCTLFSQPDLQDIRQYVQQYLLKNSKSAQSLIESTGRRGYYRLNTQGSADARQLILEFRDEKRLAAETEDTDIELPRQDLSLSLFDDF